MELDERYDWLELRNLAGEVQWVRGQCHHLDIRAVESLDGTVVAGLCVTCDQQFPHTDWLER